MQGEAKQRIKRLCIYTSRRQKVRSIALGILGKFGQLGSFLEDTSYLGKKYKMPCYEHMEKAKSGVCKQSSPVPPNRLPSPADHKPQTSKTNAALSQATYCPDSNP